MIIATTDNINRTSTKNIKIKIKKNAHATIWSIQIKKKIARIVQEECFAGTKKPNRNEEIGINPTKDLGREELGVKKECNQAKPSFHRIPKGKNKRN